MESKYLKIPVKVSENKNICSNAKMLYGFIALMCHQYSYCYATNGFFADKMSLTTRTISRLIDELKKEQLIYINYDDKMIRRIFLYE